MMQNDPESLQLLAERKSRMRAAMIVVPTIAGVVLIVILVWFEHAISYYFNVRREVFFPVLFIFIAFPVLGLLMNYLQTGSAQIRPDGLAKILQQEYLRNAQAPIEQKSAVTSSEIADLIIQIENLKSEVKRVSENVTGIDEAKKETLVAIITSRIQQDAADRVWKDLEKKLEAATQASNQYRDISNEFEQARFRLALEVSALGRRGNVNLILGIITTIMGLILLAYIVFSTGDPSTEPVRFAIHFLPRLTLVLFIEVFAYFFLRLYKSSLAEIKYFQNEVTNMEAKYIALKTALSIGDQQIIGSVIAQLGNTERNHILEKGQTTTEIERTRIDREGLSEATKHLSSIFSKKFS